MARYLLQTHDVTMFCSHSLSARLGRPEVAPSLTLLKYVIDRPLHSEFRSRGTFGNNNATSASTLRLGILRSEENPTCCYTSTATARLWLNRQCCLLGSVDPPNVQLDDYVILLGGGS